MKRFGIPTRVVAAFSAFGLPVGAMAQPCARMIDLGNPYGEGAQAIGVSPDGKVVVGRVDVSADIYHAFVWQADTGMFELESSGGTRAAASGISAIGSIVAGQASLQGNREVGVLWYPDGGTIQLTLGGTIAWTSGISADGSVAVGTATTWAGGFHPFRWTATDGAVDIGSDRPGQAAAVSSDASTIVGKLTLGFGPSTAFAWTSERGLEELPGLGGTTTDALAVSSDGSVIVGLSRYATGLSRAVIWTGRVIQDLGTFGGGSAYASAVSGDGTAVGVVVRTDTGSHAFRWTARTGGLMLPTPSTRNSRVYSASADGRVLVGNYLDEASNFHAVMWIVGRDADFNDDGFTDIFDFNDFVFAFEAADAAADFNEDGFLDFADFDAFVTAFEAGC